MGDMTAFERQLEARLERIAGPEPHVDAMASARSAMTIASARRPFAMFAALKFIAAAVIVALFGGFLLTGILSTPQGDEMAPAAVTESPSPMTTEELISGMVTEEVEPGVYRVVNDGVRDLSYPLGGWDVTGFVVDVTPDGSVWVSVDEGDHGLFRLGEEPVFEDVTVVPSHREVAPDGSLWAIGDAPDDRFGIFSFDGEGWTLRATTTGDPRALAVGPDGTVWVGSDTALLRLEDDGSLTTFDWSDVYGGDARWPGELAVTPDGDVWLVGTRSSSWDGGELLLRFDGEGWARIPGPIPGPEGWEPGHRGRGLLEVGADGALWVKASRTGVARFDDPGWTTFTEADGVEPWGVPDDVFTNVLEVAADGSLWLIGLMTDEPEDCCGVSHYDGTTWTSYLVGSLVHDFAIAPDGSVWLGADDLASPLRLYVITPEAVAATE